MASNKTMPTKASVDDFISKVKDDEKRQDSKELIKMLKKQSGFEPEMWGPGIVGFGSYHYKYESGREGDSVLVGFSPRVSALTLYLSANFENRGALLEKLGKHKTGKSCIYIKKLTDIDKDVLMEMVKNHLKYMKETYPVS